MAQMMFQFEDCENTGEQEFYRYCEANLGDEIIIFHNRYLDGLEFDFCLLIPDYGVLIVEVKGWNKETYQGYHEGKLIIKEKDKTEKEHPVRQAKLYKNILENLIRNQLGKTPLIEMCVCFTRWDDEFLKKPELFAYMGHSNRQLYGKNDLETKERFYHKLYANFLPSMREKKPFTQETMIKIMDFFEPGYAQKVLEKQREEHPITGDTSGRSAETSAATEQAQVKTEYNDSDTGSENQDEKKVQNRKKEIIITPSREIPPYSIVAIVKQGRKDILDRLIGYYSQGAKITAVLVGRDLQEYAAQKLEELYRTYSIIDDDGDLLMSRQEMSIQAKDSLRLFFWSSYVIESENRLASEDLFVVDGQVGNKISVLKEIDAQGKINLEQYLVEHEDDQKNILVRAGAGTGKTTVMIDRVAFLIYRHQMSSAELRDRILMITFTDAAADNMRERLKKHFQNLYLLTGHGEYLAMVGQVNQMQISTIHSYALNLIKKLCVFSGYSSEVMVESGQYNRRRHLEEALEEVLAEKTALKKDYVQSLGVRIFEIREKLLAFIGALENKSVDLTKLDVASFGQCPVNPALHKLFMDVISRSERAFAQELLDNGKIFLGQLMPELVRAVEAGKKNNRLKNGTDSRDRYMFVDEFQDTDDDQISVLLQIAEAMEYHMFCVGDEKQCIYRFRGAEEQAFSRLGIESHADQWQTHGLVHNYRTDQELLSSFEPFFEKWGNQELLNYDAVLDRLDNPVFSNNGLIPEYMHQIMVKDAEDRLPALVEEIRARISCIMAQPDQHRGKKDKVVAVLVRENWQARDIVDYIRANCGHEFELQTDAGGDLFQSDPALDMLSLCQALQKDDPAVLSHFADGNLIQARVDKAHMYKLKDQPQKSAQRTPQLEYLHGLINQRLEATAGKEEDFRSLEEIRHQLRLYPAMQVLHQVYMQLNPWETLPDGLNYRLNVDELFERFVRGGTGAGTNLEQFTAYLGNCIFSKKEAESRAVEENKEQRPVVKCLTVHKSKGLEYGYVILPFMDLAIDIMKKTGMDVILHEDGRIGYNYNIGSQNIQMRNDYFNEQEEKDEKKKEETRILYVAMTRARKGFSWIGTEKNTRTNWQKLMMMGGQQG